MEHLEYLFAAYSIIFILIGLYVIFIGRRQARLEREVGRLEALGSPGTELEFAL